MSTLNITPDNFELTLSDVARQVSINIRKSLGWAYNVEQSRKQIITELIKIPISQLSTQAIMDAVRTSMPDKHKNRLVTVCASQLGNVDLLIYHFEVYIYTPQKVYPGWDISITPKIEHSELMRNTMLNLFEDAAGGYGYDVKLTKNKKVITLSI